MVAGPSEHTAADCDLEAEVLFPTSPERLALTGPQSLEILSLDRH